MCNSVQHRYRFQAGWKSPRSGDKPLFNATSRSSKWCSRGAAEWYRRQVLLRGSFESYSTEWYSRELLLIIVLLLLLLVMEFINFFIVFVIKMWLLLFAFWTFHSFFDRDFYVLSTCRTCTDRYIRTRYWKHYDIKIIEKNKQPENSVLIGIINSWRNASWLRTSQNIHPRKQSNLHKKYANARTPILRTEPLDLETASTT